MQPNNRVIFIKIIYKKSKYKMLIVRFVELIVENIYKLYKKLKKMFW